MRSSPNAIRRTLLAGLVGLAFATTAAHGYKPYLPPSMPFLTSNLVQVDVYNRTTGAALPIYPNNNRNWIEGVPGHEYAVRIRNCTGARILVVTSVDGVNVISGDTASPSQSGYVLEPYGSVEIQGWRKSMARTAAFYFTDLGDSYAARTGRPQNVGVIGVAVFQEKVNARIAYNEWGWRGRRAPKNEAESRAAATAEARNRAERGVAAPASPPAPAPATAAGEAAPGEGAARDAGARMAEPSARADAATPAQTQRHPPLQAAQPMAKLGTGHGRNEESRVTMTDFERATSHPAETLTVQYDRRENLVAMGVLPQPIPPIARRDPNPFPGVRFAPDPR